MKQLVSILILSIVISSTGFAQKGDGFKWLTGTWKITGKRGTIVERWVQQNDSTFAGTSIFVKAPGDSAVQERLELRLRAKTWHYVSTVTGQNNNQPVSFEVIFPGRDEFISVNPKHDYPQRIAYRRVGDKLYASIEGNRGGKYVKGNYDFGKE